MKKYTVDQLNTYAFPLKDSEKKIKLTVYLSEEQVRHLEDKYENFWIGKRTWISKKEGEVKFYPELKTIEKETKKVKRKHVGNYFFPDLQGIWRER